LSAEHLSVQGFDVGGRTASYGMAGVREQGGLGGFELGADAEPCREVS
jgi:hypothetical protein